MTFDQLLDWMKETGNKSTATSCEPGCVESAQRTAQQGSEELRSQLCGELSVEFCDQSAARCEISSTVECTAS